MTTSTSQIFVAAHAAAKVASAVIAYKVRFASALKSAWAAAKQTVKNTMGYDSNNHEQVMRDIYERNLAEARDLSNEDNQYRVRYAPSKSQVGMYISLDWRAIKYLKEAQAIGTLAQRFPQQAFALDRFFKGDVQQWVASMVRSLKNAGRAQFLTEAQVQQQLNALGLTDRLETIVREA